NIRDKALSLGFDAAGFCAADLSPEIADNLHEFLNKNYHGDMNWLVEKFDWRKNPQALWPEAKSVIMLGHNYAPPTNPLEKLANKTIGNISCYAQNVDYHDVIKKKLKQLAGWLAREYSCDVKVFVDTAPVMEKPLAQQAGLGWQGKHTCLVSREFGSWLFLGAIFTTLPIATNQQPTTDSCGTCTKCLDICPTNAFDSAGKIDARKCISYLTIEHKEQIPLEYRKAIGNRIYGCDDCLAICPWNKFAKNANEIAYHPRTELQSPLLKDLVILDDMEFRALFRKSPVKRIGRDRFVRNVLIAIGNSGDAALTSVITPLANDPSPLVSEMAIWAIEELENHTKSYSMEF
ncbi:MAG: tRNA epoxyqueuosine(34) reductase QueG, partial [Rickettsiales bacterium]